VTIPITDPDSDPYRDATLGKRDLPEA